MQHVPSTEFARNFGRYREVAQREPVAVTSHDRVTAVLISQRDFEEYQRLRAAETRAYWVHELPDETIRAIVDSRPHPGDEHLNALLDD